MVFRATGPWSPEQGLFFDPAKLLLDPYATVLDRRFVFDSRLVTRNAEPAALVPKAIRHGAFGAGCRIACRFSPQAD